MSYLKYVSADIRDKSEITTAAYHYVGDSDANIVMFISGWSGAKIRTNKLGEQHLFTAFTLMLKENQLLVDIFNKYVFNVIITRQP